MKQAQESREWQRRQRCEIFGGGGGQQAAATTYHYIVEPTTTAANVNSW